MSTKDTIDIIITLVVVAAVIWLGFKLMTSDLGDKLAEGCMVTTAYMFFGVIGGCVILAILVTLFAVGYTGMSCIT